MSLSLLGRIGEQKRGYLVERLNGKRTICFFSPLDVNDWYCLRYVALCAACPVWPNPLLCVDCACADCVRAAFGTRRRAHPRVYDPYRRMTAALNRTHEVENVQQAAEQVEKIVA